MTETGLPLSPSRIRGAEQPGFLEPGLFRDLFEHLPEAATLSVAVRDATGRAIDMRLVHMNERARAGQPDPESTIGGLCSVLWPQILVNGAFDAFMRVLDTGVAESGEFEWTDSRTYAPAGYDYRAVRVGDDLLLCVLRDGTEAMRRLQHEADRLKAALSLQRELESALAHQSLHDALTGLPNRALLHHRLTSAIAGLEHRDGAVGVLFVKIDKLKQVNDAHGHSVGDDVLVAVARRLQRNVRPRDTVGRFASNEFVVVYADLDDAADASALAMQINEDFRRPLVADGRSLALTVSIGVTASTEATSDPDHLLRDADIAVHRATAQGGDRCATFDAALHQRVRRRMDLEVELRQALDGDQFVVEYQPVVDLTSGELTGVEALVRWQHPQRGLVQPGEFIGLAEESGLIVPLGAWILGEACRQAHRWHRAFPRYADLALSVNLSAEQIEHPELLRVVRSAIAVSGIDPSTLGLEITESVLMRDSDAAAATLNDLKQLGVRLSLDDFGTGYSSLAYLHKFPIDILKIDRRFIIDLGVNPQHSILCTAIIGLARALGLHTIAEGIETAQQLERLVQLGCDGAQGYYFSRPVPAERIDELLAAHRRWPMVAGATTPA